MALFSGTYALVTQPNSYNHSSKFKYFNMKKILTGLLFFCNQAFSQTDATLIKTAISEGVYKSFTGQVQIKQTEQKSLLLFFTTSEGDQANFDKSILIETNSSDKSIELSDNDKCEVFIPQSRKYILINNLTRQKVVFVGLYDVETAIASVSVKLAGQSLGHNFIGFGLSYMENKWSKDAVLKQTSLVADEVLLKANNNIPASVKETGVNKVKGVTCHSGGAGASQCSVEEGLPITQVCSVTCNAGYYACCNTSTFKCKCYPNGTIEAN